MSVVHGGKTIYGANVGILMLETQFPRIFGDIANAATWPFPVQYRIVRGATPDKVVRNDPRLLVDDFIAAAKDLVAHGCDGLTTNCGFLALIQDQISEAVPVPVATSSLMQIPMVQALLPKSKRVGVITISKATLTPAHLEAAGAPLDTPIVGTDNGRAFTHGILDDQPSIDFEASRLDLLDAARDLVTQNDDIGAIVLECTNMTPYAADIRKLTGLPVYSIYSFVRWFHQGLVPDRFELDLDDPLLNLAR
ncbi:aspartate/glutamate racemase family protein [Cochlodiniinecator piscidefendens]|uniref:aspartate/glutamate racemase family protein n=1 Tax=Cochlodiniinecator piscidefendens TaxID=2715756 RepID=UPI0014078D8E|nr:aspartate/glutamate racemase family protein [Cochlodiniinecator piscidefendens]